MIAKKTFKFNCTYYITAIIVIIFIAFILRVLCVVFVPTVQMYDFATYQQIAENIARGFGHTLDGVPVAWQGSGYAYVLGGFYKLIGNSGELYGKLLNIFLSTATLVFSYFVYRKLFDRRLHAVISLAITAFFPSCVLYVNVIGTEVFFSFLLSALIFVQLYVKNLKILFPVIGLLTGAAALTKPFMLAYPVITAAFIWVESKNYKRALVSLLVIYAVTAAVVSPWSYRNYMLFGRFIPVSYNSGYVLYINNNDTNVTGSWLDVSVVENEYVQSQLDSYIGETGVKMAPDLEPLLKSEAQKWILANPAEFIKLGFLRLNSTFFSGANDLRQWALNGISFEHSKLPRSLYYRNMNVIYSFFDICFTIVNSMGLVFLFMCLKKYIISFFDIKTVYNNNFINIVFTNIAFFVLIVFVFEGQARYAYPVLMFMVPASIRLGLNLKNW